MAQGKKRVGLWQRQVALWNSITTLAAWRWRTQRLLLLVIAIGITLAVALMGVVPLFSNVMATAGLRSILRAQPNSGQIIASANLQGLSSAQIASTTTQIDRVLRRDTGHYLNNGMQTALITNNWYLSYGGFTIDFYGISLSAARAHLRMLQGQIPSETESHKSSIDIMLTSSEAQALGNIKVGSTIPLAVLLLTKPANNNIGLPGGPLPYTNILTAYVSGIFQVNPDDAFWNGYTLEAPPLVSRQTPPPFLALTSQASLLNLLDAIAAQQQVRTVYPADKSQSTLLVSYTLNTSAITGDKLDNLIAQLGNLQQDIYRTFAPTMTLEGADANIFTVNLSGPVLHNPDTASTLEKFRSQVEIMQTPTVILTAEIACLLLFFVSTIVAALVEREQLPIAVLRSRGSSRWQIFGALLIQVCVLCVCAAFSGPLLAVGLVALIGPHFLTASTQDALNTLNLDASSLTRSLYAYMLIALAAAFLTLFVTISLAVRANILTREREDARSTYRPFWQRLQLDLVISVLAIGGYVLIVYLENIQPLLNSQSESLVSTPLELLAPLLLVLAGILLFLRLFPLLLRRLARLTRRRSDITVVFTLAQMERAPRQPMRMALLLGLATAFALFSLIFSASQGQRAGDLATYQAVSDFAGYNTSLPSTTPSTAASILNQTATAYLQIAGVTSATVGYVDSRYLFVNGGTTQEYTRKTILSAVDADTFAQTAFWSSQYSSESLNDLMTLLVSLRQQSIAHGVVPAIVASSTWEWLGLTPGMTFHLTDDYGDADGTTYVAVAEVDHIPPVDDGVQGALLVDYQSLVAGRARVQKTTSPNYIWLRTSNNPAMVNQVRQALANPVFALTNLVDRRALNSDSSGDPLVNNLLSLLSIGVVVALLLAFLANLLLPLLSVRTRQTSFALLRALGVAPRQVTRIFTWELTIVLATALLLGLVFGALLAFTSVPPLIFSGVQSASLVDTSSQAIYTVQQIIPVTIVLPSSLLVALLVLLLVSLLAIGLMTRLAQRTQIARALLIDDD